MKMFVWSPACQQLKRISAISQWKHLSEFYPQDGGERQLASKLRRCHPMWSDVTESMVTIQSPLCGYNAARCGELKGGDLSCYSDKTESVSLRICPYDRWLTNNAHLSAITVTNISESFTYMMAAKINWHRYWTIITSLTPYVYMRMQYWLSMCMTVNILLIHLSVHTRCIIPII